MTAPSISFPRQDARTIAFTLGVPHAFAIAPDGSRIAFLRARSGSDRDTGLWVRDVAAGTDRLIADAQELLGGGEENLPPEERARRERARQAAAGVVTFEADQAVRIVAFALSGRLFVADLEASPATARCASWSCRARCSTRAPTRPGRTSRTWPTARCAWCRSTVPGTGPLAVPEGENVTYGLAEFVAAEEMSRTRGFWWSPDGQRLLVARVDTTPVARWYISDPANPDRQPVEVAYPAAGTANADVSVVRGRSGRHADAGDWDSSACRT